MKTVKTLLDLAELADFSLIDTLKRDPQANENGDDHDPREVFSGHYVPVKPTPIENPRYIIHSKIFFGELGFSDELAHSDEFMKMFTGDISQVPEPLRRVGWATGYALSIYGTEYYQQCPFRTGNGYGDGRAISILEAVINSKRWEMQLKGGGRTPYCRGADGRAVLRSSIREFLAQEHMYALGIPTSRSLTLYTSDTETVMRPWFTKKSHSRDPELMIEEAVAITTRVASSFLRVGQLELFGRRARNWIRVGYCQGNFNSDNCAVGGFTLDYGPFGFIDMFEPRYQPWTGGGVHFSFLNQPQAALRNFAMFCSALEQLLKTEPKSLEQLDEIQNDFSKIMQNEIDTMWAAKLGLEKFDANLFNELVMLMIETSVDYTIFFRELCDIPEDITPLLKSFYHELDQSGKIYERWTQWFEKWKSLIHVSSELEREALSKKMKAINPKYTLREWFLVPAYEKATKGDYTLIYELQAVMTDPYAELSKEIEEKYYAKKPTEFFDIAGISHISCSS
ncbi:MAG: YdiU family protein [Campylobacterales bacterium]|nr:YdiU family protein [Campylobacterales bacterium]